jgi:crossover junction endodeoxyribonuclease RuvC
VNCRIIGIDPGLANTGFGIIDCKNNKMTLVSYGVISTKAEQSHEERLKILYEKLCMVLDEFKPDQGELETLYFARNTSSALAVAEAKGVITLALAQRKISVNFYTPNQIKYSVTGSKTADKETVQKYVAILLKLKEAPKPDHAADALAGAITHFNSCALA